MTVERFTEIQAKALEMADEIEWADFPYSRPNGRDVCQRVAADPSFRQYMRAILRETFAMLEDEYAGLSGRQEVELEAAGMIQAAFRTVIRLIAPESANLCATLMRTKFRNLPHAFIQAPMDVVVPSMEKQLAGHRPYRPADSN